MLRVLLCQVVIKIACSVKAYNVRTMPGKEGEPKRGKTAEKVRTVGLGIAAAGIIFDASALVAPGVGLAVGGEIVRRVRQRGEK